LPTFLKLASFKKASSRLSYSSVPGTAATWEADGKYPWEKNDFPLEKYELNKTLSEIADKFIEEKGKKEIDEHQKLISKLTDAKGYLPATKFSVEALYYKVWQLEREIFFIITCIYSVRTRLLFPLPVA